MELSSDDRVYAAERIIRKRIRKNEGQSRRGPKRKDKQVERTLTVEIEDEGRIDREESQDESTTRKSNSVPSTEEPPVVDDETRTGFTDELEAPDLTSNEIPADNENNSSSSDDRPILRRFEPGTKRKAEVLSKESGKIGVTIMRSSPTSSSPPPVKISKLAAQKQSPTSVSNRANGKQNMKDDENTVPSATSPTVLTATAPRSSTDKRPDSLDASLPHGTTKEPASPKPLASRTDDKQADQKSDTQETVRNKSGQIETNSVSATLTCKPLTINGHSNNYAGDDLSAMLTSPSSDYWLARNPVADQVFITDVTVNLKTVTIRECKTEKGFFKDREDNIVISQIAHGRPVDSRCVSAMDMPDLHRMAISGPPGILWISTGRGFVTNMALKPTSARTSYGRFMDICYKHAFYMDIPEDI
ncbi:polycomb group protein pc [Holotrichia oblita]|uniref:Polycomb group protein pc n=1 Tax=Holotrichia oblita TaxID=644536 RepID=A0ACB9T4A6_HOLOL|nr:polycomb group protein pc [Holotrichia oblita]